MILPLSDSEDDNTFSTTAVTPEVCPVIFDPTSWSAYADTGIPR